MIAYKIRQGQRGTSVLVVLVLLSVMLLGGVTMARLSESTTLVSGNVSNNEIALQASEVGINAAMANLSAVVNYDSEATDAATGKVWYTPVMKTDKSVVSETDTFWDARPEVTVGKGSQFKIRYYAERLCTVAAVTNPQAQCLLRVKGYEAADASGGPQITPPSYRQYRITVRVEAPKQGYTFIQSVATRG